MGTAAIHQESLGSLERDDADVLEATLSWGGDVLQVRHVPLDAAVSVGERAECTFFVPASQLGKEFAVVWPGGRDARPEAPLAVDFGPFRIAVRVVPAGRRLPFAAWTAIQESALGSVGASFAMHAVVVGALAMFLPSLGVTDAESIDRDRILTMQKFLASAAERERDAAPENASGETSGGEAAAAGMQARGASGAIGSATAPITHGHWSARGHANPREATLPMISHEAALAEARQFGMIGLVPTDAAERDVPMVPWASVLHGADPDNHLGAMWGPDPLVNWGVAGLGLSGAGEGGCVPGTPGCGEGVGIGDFAGLGRALRDRNGPCSGPDCGTEGPGDGRGYGHGRLPGTYQPKRRIDLRQQGFQAQGRIPAEVIQRIVRQNAGRYRACYEQGLRNNPSLGGHVRVKFVIDRGGGVSLAHDGGSDLPDEGVRSCVVQSFYALAFPSPEGGTVRVIYPILFSPSE